MEFSGGASQARGLPLGGRWIHAALIVALVVLVGVALLGAAPSGLAQEPDDDQQGDEAPAWGRLRDAGVVLSTDHFDVYVPRGSPLAAHAALVGETSERVLPTVEARLATPLAGRVRLVLVPPETAPPPCEPRAAAMPSRRRIVLFAGPITLEPRALAAFMAHELGHQLTFDRWSALGDDRRLSEGIATWAAEPYWLTWRGWPSMEAGVIGLRAAEAFAPLAQTPEGCLVAAERDVYYSAWASFVGYLGREYGWDRVGEALRLPSVAPDEADYPAAFGHPLRDLVAGWERELAVSAPPPSPDPPLSRADQ